MSKFTVTIERLNIGYVVTGGEPICSHVAAMSIDDCLQRVLFILTGRSEHFGGDSYGKVVVLTERPATSAVDGASSGE